MTGESLPAKKNTAVLNKEIPVSDRKNMAYAGATVINGRGMGLVVATGIRTVVGQIAGSITTTESAKPPLLIRMERFAKQISVVVLVFAVLLGLMMVSRGSSFSEVFFLMIAMMVSAIPEGLPVAMTVVLSIATSRMAKRKVIVRKLMAVESLGSCTTIASDKTGTLKVNQQTVKRILLPDGIGIDVGGQGYNDEGKVRGDEGDSLDESLQTRLADLARAGLVCNEASLTKEDGNWQHSGDAMDVALLSLAYKRGLDSETERGRFRIVGEIPFESERRYAATAYGDKEGVYVALKGSLEAILPFCARMRTASGDQPLDKDILLRQAQDLAETGYRVLSIATGPLPATDKDFGFNEGRLKDLTLLELIGFIDPLRPEVKQAVRESLEAGVRVIMITGDHPATAMAIAKELGIADSPALRLANIGVAMGSGTDIAKETALITVTVDNFASIVAGIEEGRFAYANVRKVTLLLISTGATELFLLGAAVLMGLPMPLIAVQLLWLNLVTNGIQDVALAFEAGEKGVMKLAPRRSKEGIFDRKMIGQVLISGVTMGPFCLVAWILMFDNGKEEAVARNSLLTLLVLMQFYHVLNCRSESRSAFKVPLRDNPILMVGMLIAFSVYVLTTQIPLMQSSLRTSPLPIERWLVLGGVASVTIIVMEIYKWVCRVNSSRQ